jgi:hypothetical protein
VRLACVQDFFFSDFKKERLDWDKNGLAPDSHCVRQVSVLSFDFGLSFVLQSKGDSDSLD